MQFESLSAFIAMGGYGFYVWLSFGVTALVMGILAVQSHVQHRSLLKKVLQEKARHERIRRARRAS
ncbi:heme exporter protein CcmD [Alteromonas halophila]|uniref:Heme exporter protein D n=1 Tax=Alteromonas halophila TaxID=516698 RepID=A0A918JBI8_9ALTE|nr:heme exporter protein CcmD [Alteromonas halophila]GGW72909.1 heme exporter protein D [Alteromonas halophila]